MKNLKWGVLLSMLLIVFILGACDRLGQAPEDLDVTPTHTAIPTATPSPTPAADATEDASAEMDSPQAQLDVILSVIPNTVTAGSVQWQRDNARGIEVPASVQNGVAGKVFFTEQIGGKSNITYAIFETAEDAKAHYDNMVDIREPMALGKSDASFPSPNILGAGLYGSYALFQINEIYFVEVLIEIFSSTSGNPLNPLSRQALEFLEAGITKFSTPDTKPQQIEAIVAALPDEVQAGAVTWARRLTREPEILEDIPEGRGVKALYQIDNADLFVTYVVFDTAEAMAAYYNTRLAAQREGALNYSISGGAEEADLPAPNAFSGETLAASAALLQVNERYLIELEAVGEGELPPLNDFAAQAVSVLESIQSPESASTETSN